MLPRELPEELHRELPEELPGELRREDFDIIDVMRIDADVHEFVEGILEVVYPVLANINIDNVPDNNVADMVNATINQMVQINELLPVDEFEPDDIDVIDMYQTLVHTPNNEQKILIIENCIRHLRGNLHFINFFHMADGHVVVERMLFIMNFLLTLIRRLL